jgi:hypothetical protein
MGPFRKIMMARARISITKRLDRRVVSALFDFVKRRNDSEWRFNTQRWRASSSGKDYKNRRDLRFWLSYVSGPT